MNVSESAAFIAKNSENVKIDEIGCAKLLDVMKKAYDSGQLGFNEYRTTIQHPQTKDADALDWIFFINTINFSFWTDASEPPFQVSDQNGEKHTGYWASCVCVNNAIRRGIPLIKPSYYAGITVEAMRDIFKDDSGKLMPMLEERQKSLQESGQKLMQQKFGGTFQSCVEQCERSAQKLLQIIVTEFPRFRDAATYKHREVFFFKRAQIAVADVWACFQGKGIADFADIDSITIFADYRVPQVLAWFGVLKYSDALMQRLKKNELMESGEPMEVEVRGCSIHVVNLLVDRLNLWCRSEGKSGVNASLADYFLWNYRRQHAQEVESVPFHKVRCIYY